MFTIEIQEIIQGLNLSLDKCKKNPELLDILLTCLDSLSEEESETENSDASKRCKR